MKKHYSPLATIDTCDTTHLSPQGAEQVQGFIDYLKPRYQSIVDGQIKKEEVVRYYLEQEDSYTDGAKKLISNISQALGISKGYISKIKSSDKYLNGLHNDGFRDWVNEHPVGCRYYISKVDHQASMDKFLTGEHFSRSELEEMVSRETVVTRQVSEEVKTEFQIRQDKAAEMVADDAKPLIRTMGAAQIMMTGTRKDRLAAAAQTLYDLKYEEPELKKIIQMIIQVAEQALEKPAFVPRSISQV
jgi:hypothetical protein